MASLSVEKSGGSAVKSETVKPIQSNQVCNCNCKMAGFYFYPSVSPSLGQIFTPSVFVNLV